MARPIDTHLASYIRTETFEFDGALFWKKSGTPVPVDCFRDAGMVAPATQADCCATHAREFILEYKAARANRSADAIAEEQAEARAAFGPGTRVVNVITGEKFRT